ncbi:hypothetical protein ACOSQ2_004893 [Xanthoceras sorbifolium]
MSRLLGVKVVGCHERYVGLPSFAFCNKQPISQSIRDRVWAKLKGWRSRLFSARGNKVLLKVVIQSTPAFAMNLFKPSQRLIDDLHSLSARFYWDEVGMTKLARCIGVDRTGFVKIKMFEG